MSRALVPDATVLIDLTRRRGGLSAFRKQLLAAGVWLSSVTVAELYAGTRSPEEAAILDQIVARFDRVDRLLTPTAGDWTQAGQLIGRKARLAGALQPRDHLNDVLILVSTARIGGTVVTANLRHFQAWARLAQRAGLDVLVETNPF